MTLTVAPSYPVTGNRSFDLPVSAECTVAQAAQILNMPEACIDEMLDIGILEYKQDGSQRLVKRDRLLNYKQKWESGNAALNEMARLNQEMGLYDD